MCRIGVCAVAAKQRQEAVQGRLCLTVGHTTHAWPVGGEVVAGGVVEHRGRTGERHAPCRHQRGLVAARHQRGRCIARRPGARNRAGFQHDLAQGAGVPAHIKMRLAINLLFHTVAVHVLQHAEGDVGHVDDRRPLRGVQLHAAAHGADPAPRGETVEHFGIDAQLVGNAVQRQARRLGTHRGVQKLRGQRRRDVQGRWAVQLALEHRAVFPKGAAGQLFQPVEHARQPRVARQAGQLCKVGQGAWPTGNGLGSTRHQRIAQVFNEFAPIGPLEQQRKAHPLRAPAQHPIDVEARHPDAEVAAGIGLHGGDHFAAAVEREQPAERRALGVEGEQRTVGVFHLHRGQRHRVLAAAGVGAHHLATHPLHEERARVQHMT